MCASQAPPPSRSADPSSAEDDDTSWEPCEHDGLWPNREESDESVHKDDGEVEWNTRWLELGEEEEDLHASLLRFANANGDYPNDKDWGPKCHFRGNKYILFYISSGIYR
jgi:hypothetical protein